MKVRVINTTFSGSVGESINGKIFDAEKEGRLYTISARDLHKINPDAFEVVHGKYHFYPNEIEVLPESAHEKFKVGDNVRFKKEFYKEEYFKGLTRENRKQVADAASLGEFEVSWVYESSRRVRFIDKFHNCYDTDASLLELCKEPEVKEVKRIAKVGEWIKIVDARYDSQTTKEDYVDGDIVQVESLYNGDIGIMVKGKRGKSVYTSHCEYVVLENYSPEEKPSETPKEEPKKIAKVGDFIKITSFDFGDEVGTVAEVIEVRKTCVKHKSNKSCRGYYYARHYEYEIVEPPKRKWTDEEIIKAKCFLAEELVNGKCKFTFDINNNETTCYNFESNKIKSAKCAYNDECNRYIGAVVAYCKTSGVKIPEFIQH